MNIIVPVRFVPDLVEELEIDESGAALDETFLDLILSEFDDHAIEQAILLKERHGANVIVVTPDLEEADDVLAIAAAKGADRLVKLVESGPAASSSHGLALLLAETIKRMPVDLILTGVQAHDDLDGQLGPLLAEHLGMPYLGYIAGVRVGDGIVTARKEYPGGLLAEMEVTLPAVLGIQAPGSRCASPLRRLQPNSAGEEDDSSGSADSGSASVDSHTCDPPYVQAQIEPTSHPVRG